MKPLISYYGGKQRMAPKIVPLIPPHTVYCEPFSGGAAVFYAKPVPVCTNSHHYRETLNDINGELMNMYTVAREMPKEFSGFMDTLPFSAAVHKHSRMSFATREHRAAAFFLNNQMSFGNVVHGGFQRGTFGRNLSSTFEAAKKRLYAASLRLNGVTLDSIDFAQFIEKWDSPQTFFYVDPPYLGTRIDGMGKWDQECLERLIDVLNECRGTYIVSSYNLRQDSLKGASVQQFFAHCSVSGHGKTTKTRNHGEPLKSQKRDRIELLHMRGPTAPVRSSLIPVLEKQTCFTGPLLGPCPLPLKTHPSARQEKKSAG